MSNIAQIKIQLSNGEEAGKTIHELTAQSAKLAREVKKLEIGSEDWVKASEDFKLISGHLKNVKKEAYDTAEAQNYLNSMFADMVPYQKEFANMAKGIKGVGAAVKGTTSMFQLLKVAIAATGIGLLVVALGSLVTYLSKTQKGMDFVKKVTASLGAAFNVVIERVANFGEGMFKLFSFDFEGAWNSMKKAVSGFGDELAKETKATWENTAAMQALNKQQSDLEERKAKTRAQIEKLKMVTEDQTKSESERLAAAQKAFDLESSLLNQSISLQQQKIKLIESENEMKGDTRTEDDNQARRDAVIELANLEEESFTKQTELQNKINELKKAGAVETKKLKEEEFKVVTENLEKEFEALGNQIGREVEATRKAEEEKAKLREEAIAGRMEELDREFEMQQLKLEEQFFSGQITEEGMRQKAFDQEKAFLEQRLEELALLGSTEQEQYQEIYTQLAYIHAKYNEDRKQSDLEYANAKFALEQQSLAAAGESFNAVIGWLERDEKAKRKNFAVVKAMRLAELTVSSIGEIQAIWKSAAENPLNAIFPGAAQIIAGVKTAAALVRYGTGVSKMNQTTFADGGVVKGPSHQAGGIPFSVKGSRVKHEMEGNEIILSKGVYQDPVLRGLASELNVMGGGRSFSLGGPVLSTGSDSMNAVKPNSIPSIVSSVDSAKATMSQSKTEEYLKIIAEASVITANKPVLSTHKIREELTTLRDVEEDARF